MVSSQLLISFILLSCWNLFDFSQGYNQCSIREKLCSSTKARLLVLTWCCEENEKCANTYSKCILPSNDHSTARSFSITILIVSICIAVCTISCLQRQSRRVFLSRQTVYEPVVAINCILAPSVAEQLPPSYEEAMNSGAQ
ncbi:unnamed protein product [Adineta ricciae]|uniref:Transmembrane protein n=1 Tax=Adineta ricciae TaxID=249248 RepID=A0A813PMH7_ADIRI|nr:unnamed protein product [Adineta ricciae]